MDSTTTPNNLNGNDDLSNSSPLRPGSAERALNLASALDEKARDAAATAAQKAEDAGTALGGGLRSLGSTVRDLGPESGVTGDATTAVADALEGSGRYLQEEGIKEMAADVTNLIRRNPIPALLLGLAAGFLVGRVLTPRS